MIDPSGHKLPDRTEAVGALACRCPWCHDDIDDLSIPMDSLRAAHEGDTLTGHGNWLLESREFEGAETVCPRCGRGLLVKFVRDRYAPHSQMRSLVIAPLRSEADRRFIAEKLGLF